MTVFRVRPHVGHEIASHESREDLPAQCFRG
jgi:hypothetical protein